MHKIATLNKALFLFFSLLVAACSQEAADKELAKVAADQIITGAKIYTVDDNEPWAEAVAIKDGRFIFVGNAEKVKAYQGQDTQVNHLAGKFIIPGLIDGHTHPGYIELEKYGPIVENAGPEQLFKAIKEFADNNPGDGWIRACCWSNKHFVREGEGPHKEQLDAIVQDRPVWVTSQSWHSYWLNSKGLEVLGVNNDTPDPKPGVAEYVRDNNGELTGWVKEGAGWQYFASQFEIADKAAQQKHIVAFLQTLSEYGVTTVYDAGNFGYEDHVYSFLAELDKAGQLPLRYEGTTQIFIPEARHKAIAEMKRMRRAYGGERLRFRTIKLFMDGVFENRSGALLADYSDMPNYKASTTLSVKELKEFLLELHKEKFDLHIHALGDGAVRAALDAVEAAKEVVGESFYPRVTLAHLHYVDPAEWPRFARLNVTANFTPWWHGFDEVDPADVALGENRSANTYRAKPIFDAGGNVTFSSDMWSLYPLSPFFGMHIGHNRKYPEELAEGEKASENFRPPAAEKLDLKLLIKGYTINGAYPFRMENQIGSIEVGKLADLVVLEKDLFESNSQEIYQIKAQAVMMEGKIIRGKL